MLNSILLPYSKNTNKYDLNSIYKFLQISLNHGSIDLTYVLILKTINLFIGIKNRGLLEGPFE